MAASSVVFDIAISFDATGSMYSCLEEVKRRLRDMMRKLKRDIPNIRIGVFAHGDYDTDHTYVTKYKDFTADVEALCSFVNEVKGTGAGLGLNSDEAYELALQGVCRDFSWRPGSQRILVLIGDMNPHEPDYFLNKNNVDWRQEMRNLREKDVRIYAVECRGCAFPFYQTIASQTFGNHVPLSDFKEVEDVLMKICYREAGVEEKLKKGGPSSSALSHRTGVKKDTHLKPDDDIYMKSDEDDPDNAGYGMLCHTCKFTKLPDEFPPVAVTEACTHPALSCLRCTVKHVEEKRKCPEKGCDQSADPDSDNMKWFRCILETMFLDYQSVIDKARLAARPEGDVINVTTLGGELYWVPYNTNMTILELKKKVGGQFTPVLAPEKQKILYNDVSLSNRKKISDYNIPKNTTVHLILPLYSVDPNLDHVIFDLSWEFHGQLDFLDATCMAFAGREFVQVIDWNHASNDYYLKNSIKHTEENLTGPGAKTGHQVIHVHLKRVPSNVDRLFFTLSSWKSPDLSKFLNPTLQFYDASDKESDLCETTFGHALSSQAVIMCSVVRLGGGWEIFEYGKEGLVGGNSKRYNPIRKKIVEMIDSE